MARQECGRKVSGELIVAKPDKRLRGCPGGELQPLGKRPHPAPRTAGGLFAIYPYSRITYRQIGKRDIVIAFLNLGDGVGKATLAVHGVCRRSWRCWIWRATISSGCETRTRKNLFMNRYPKSGKGFSWDGDV